MTITKKTGLATIMLLSVLGLAACSDDSAENAGEQIDEVVTDAGNAVEDACEDIKDKANAEDTDC